MKLKPVALSLSQAEIDEIATELLEAMQPDWQNAVTISVTSSYTVPANGMIVGIIGTTSGSTADGYLLINNVSAARIERQTNFTKDGTVQCIVNKGDVVTMSGINPTWQYMHFVPFKTMNPVSLRPLDKTKIDASVVQHWDDITSDFSIPGSASGFVLQSVKYNSVLQQLKIIVKKTTSSAASTTFKLYLQYNGSDSIHFGDSTAVLWNHFGPANGYLAGMEYGMAVMAANKLEIDTYNRNSSNAWAANDTFRGIIWL